MNGKTKIWRRILFIGAIFSAILTVQVTAQDAPPKAEARNVRDDYFGQKITDPYRWMENLKADETREWIRGQADYAKNYLNALPMRNEIFDELNKMSNTGVGIGNVRPRGNLFFYPKRNPGEQDIKLYAREGMNGAERLLIDPAKFNNGSQHYSFGNWNISWDGKYVSYILAAGGSENGELHVVEVATGRDLGERIDRTKFGSGAWLPDGKTFLYSRMQMLAPGASPTERYQKMRIYRHTLGTDPDKDIAAFGFDVNSNIKFDQSNLVFISTMPGQDYAVATVNSGSAPNSEYYVAPLTAFSQSSPIPWRKIVSLDDEVTTFDTHGDDLYLLTYKNAQRSKILRTSFSKPDIQSAETVFSGNEAVVEDLSAMRDALYVQTLDAGNNKIYRINYKTRKPVVLKLPYDGSATLAPSDLGEGIYFYVVSWSKSPAHFKYNPKAGTEVNTNLVPPLPIDMSGIEFVNAKAKSYDGTLVPLVIIYKKGLKRDGMNPVLMNGYGAYGTTNISVRFLSTALPWLNRGGVMVLAGVRGGGEYGEAWHQAGFQKTKPNTWLDFISCAEYLVNEKYTSPKHLGIEGGSAGGILISNAIAERPDLFGAAIDQVGLNNVLRSEITANGVPNIPEFGSVKTEEGFRNLLAMDGYSKIKDGVKYPAVLLTTGINDPRVEPWMSAKMAARLQAATRSEKPILLRIDYDTGHGIGSTKKQVYEEIADTYAFLFQQLK